MKGFAGGLQCKSSRDEATWVSCWIWFSGSHKTNLTHFISLKQKKKKETVQLIWALLCTCRIKFSATASWSSGTSSLDSWWQDNGTPEAHPTKSQKRNKVFLTVPGMTHRWLIDFDWIYFLFNHGDRITVSLLPNGTRWNQSLLGAQSDQRHAAPARLVEVLHTSRLNVEKAFVSFCHDVWHRRKTLRPSYWRRLTCFSQPIRAAAMATTHRRHLSVTCNWFPSHGVHIKKGGVHALWTGMGTEAGGGRR